MKPPPLEDPSDVRRALALLRLGYRQTSRKHCMLRSGDAQITVTQTVLAAMRRRGLQVNHERGYQQPYEWGRGACGHERVFGAGPPFLDRPDAWRWEAHAAEARARRDEELRWMREARERFEVPAP